MLIIILTTVLLSEEIILVVLYRVITASSHFNPEESLDIGAAPLFALFLLININLVILSVHQASSKHSAWFLLVYLLVFKTYLLMLQKIKIVIHILLYLIVIGNTF